MMPDVLYKDVPGFPGYRVGSDGSVWSCRRLARFGNRISYYQIKPTSSSGYGRVGLSKNKVVHTKNVHRLVLEAFVGPPSPGTEACHNNGDSLDNRLDNLRWDLPVANAKDRKRHGRTWCGEQFSFAKLTEENVKEIKTSLLRGEKLIDIARRFSVNGNTIGSIRYEVTWRHVPPFIPMRQKNSNEPTLRKIDPGTNRTVYEVRLGKELIGYVYSVVGFSYRGTQGWNAGVRCRDFHPIEWHYGLTLNYEDRRMAYNRRAAVEQLLSINGHGTNGKKAKS